MNPDPLTEPIEDSSPPWLMWSGRIGAVSLFLAFLLAPTPDGLSPAAQRLGAVVALMAICWMTQAIAIEVTSLLPLALFPLLGIMSAKEVSQSYFSDSSFLYMGGFVLALGIERWGLHRRIALAVTSAIGVGSKRIVLGFMLGTFVISMWISNTAATLLMLPIVMALLSGLEECHADEPRRDPAFRHLAMAATLGVGYSATIGGMATLVGTPTNLVFVDIFQKLYPEAPPMSAGQWMTIWVPFSVVFVLIAWGLLTLFSGEPRWKGRLDRGLFRRQLSALGPMQTGERWMLGLFAFTVAAWLLRTDFKVGEAVLIPGWGRLANHWLTYLGVTHPGDWVNDSTVAMFVAVVMFVVTIRSSADQVRTPLMDWPTASRLPWGILLLFGGGFALADACKSTGLSQWAGERLAVLVEGQPVWLMILVIGVLVTFLSELTSNVATANALLPMIAGTAVALELDPRLLMIPAAIASSCGFMLPVSTPPHAIVFGTGRIRLSEMARYGIVLNFVGALLMLATATWLLEPQLGIERGQLPDWAKPHETAAAHGE
ncbi:MAG: SLC13 family permease [Planctomycetaceae bacterium]